MNTPITLASIAAHPFFLAEGALGRGLIGTVVIGLIIGVIAKLIAGGKEPTGCIITILIGIAGSFVALFIGRAIGHYEVGQAPGFVASVLGAVLLLIVYHMMIRKSGPGA